MAQNDLIETLENAEYPIDLCHSKIDELVPYANVPDVNANTFAYTAAGNYCVGQVGIGFIVTYDASLYVIKEKHEDGGGTSQKGRKCSGTEYSSFPFRELLFLSRSQALSL